MSLRRSFLVFAAALAVIGTGVAVALILLTTNLHRAAQQVAIEVESLRAGEQLELELISLREETDSLARAAAERAVRHHMVEAASYITIGQEQEILAELTRRVDQYIAALDRAAAAESSPERVRSDTRAAFEPVFALARQWMQVNVEQGRAAERAAAHWAQVANIVAVAAI